MVTVQATAGDLTDDQEVTVTVSNVDETGTLSRTAEAPTTPRAARLPWAPTWPRDSGDGVHHDQLESGRC